MSTPIKMTWDQWQEKYKPVKNFITEREEVNGWIFETYGEDVEYIRFIAFSVNPGIYKANNIWTFLNDTETIIPGFHYVNRFGYFITEVPHNNEDITVIDELPVYEIKLNAKGTRDELMSMFMDLEEEFEKYGPYDLDNADPKIDDLTITITEVKPTEPEEPEQ